MKTPRRLWIFAFLALSLVLLFVAACATLEVGIVSDTSPDRLASTPSATPSTSARDVDATISALSTINAYLATRVAAQATPGPGLESTVSALATMSSYLATRGPARVTIAPDATFTPPPPTDGSLPYCRPAEASVELSASATTLEVGQAVSVTVTLANGAASQAKLGLILYTLEVRPSGVLTSADLGPVEHPITLEPGRSDRAAFVLRAAAPGRATLTGSTSYEMHALDYSSGSWSGCRSGPLEIIITPAADPE